MTCVQGHEVPWWGHSQAQVAGSAPQAGWAGAQTTSCQPRWRKQHRHQRTFLREKACGLSLIVNKTTLKWGAQALWSESSNFGRVPFISVTYTCAYAHTHVSFGGLSLARDTQVNGPPLRAHPLSDISLVCHTALLMHLMWFSYHVETGPFNPWNVFWNSKT